MKTKHILLHSLLCALLLASCKKDRDAFHVGPQAHDMFHVKNGDYPIPVLVRGNTAAKKIILYIQGGPGYSSLDYALVDFPGWTKTLEKDYAVAYYDQRGTGVRQGRFDRKSNTMTAWVEDLHQVAAFLKSAYDAEIIMLGHSFGGALMYRYIIEKGPDAIPTRYISSNAPVTTDADSDTLRWKFRRDFLQNTAELEISRNNNVARWQEARQWLAATPVIKKTEDPNPYQLFDQWNAYVEALVYEQYPGKSPAIRDYLKSVFLSPYNPIPAYLNEKYKSGLVSDLLKDEAAFNLMAKLPQISHQPLLILTGRYDDICPPEELAYVFAQIASPEKKMEVIDRAGHDLFNDQSELFYASVRHFIE